MILIPIRSLLPESVLSEIMRVALASRPAPQTPWDVQQLGRVIEVVGARIIDRIMAEGPVDGS